LRRTPDVIEIQQVHTVRAVEAGHVVTETCQLTSYRGADAAAMPGDQNAHAL
jgi:hypothetical protein